RPVACRDCGRCGELAQRSRTGRGLRPARGTPCPLGVSLFAPPRGSAGCPRRRCGGERRTTAPLTSYGVDVTLANADRDHVTAPTAPTSAPPPLTASSAGDRPIAEDLTIVAILNELLRQRWLVIAFVIVFPAIVVGVASLGRRSYTSTSAFMPGSR